MGDPAAWAWTRRHAGRRSNLCTFLRNCGITPRIARRGIERSDRLGRHRWVVERVERALLWLNEFRRLHRRLTK